MVHLSARPVRSHPDGALSPAPEDSQALDRRGPLRPERLATLRQRVNGALAARLFQLSDAVLLFSVAGAHELAGTPSLSLGLGLAMATGACLLLGAGGAYRFSRREPSLRHLANVGGATLGGILGAGLLAGSLAPGHALPGALTSFSPPALGGILLLHCLWLALVARWRTAGRLTPNLVVVGATTAAERLIVGALQARDVNVLGIFDDRRDRAPERILGVPVLGDTESLLSSRILPCVDRIVITVPQKAQHRVRAIVSRLEVLPNDVMLLVEHDAPDRTVEALSRLCDLPLARISGQPARQAAALVKRLQDILLAAIGLVVLSPVLLLVALAVRLDTPGPVLFRQRRHGFNNEEIMVLKFRSMRTELTDATASRQVTADDERVTRVGRFIRRTSLDELPQLFNVLKGEMSLVGPRPHAIGMRTAGVESHRLVAEYAHRHRMKPGITGWAAINGSRGPVDTPEAVRRRVSLDLEYVSRQSFWFDLYIIAMTLPCLLGDREAVR